jgi:BirA family biotin operon repressor/biotin-[acetyl-CoA-carboxylase] ligase
MGRRETGTLAPDEVMPLLRGRFGTPYVYADTCDSTQRLVGEASPEGAVAACELQTSGRGRVGRTWTTPHGAAVLCSVVLRPPAERAAPELSLVAGLAVAQTVEAVSRKVAAIKWPNDVLVAGRKVAGILAEKRGPAVVVGVGLNVNQTQAELPDRPLYPPASLRTLDGETRERAPILAELLVQLERRYDEWLEHGLAALLPALGARDALRGLAVSVDGVRGIAAGIAPDGRLRLDTPAGARLVAAGEASVEGSAGTL